MQPVVGMVTKNLAIREAVYRKLAKEKRKDESFSDVIERILNKRRSLVPSWGALANSKNLAAVGDDIAKIRKRTKVRCRESIVRSDGLTGVSTEPSVEMGNPVQAIEGLMAHVKKSSVAVQHEASKARASRASSHAARRRKHIPRSSAPTETGR